MRAKILVIPVYQKHWLYHVWTESSAAETAAERPVDWTQGASLQDKIVLFGKELSYTVNATAAKQWKSIRAAEEGTFKHKLYRLAQWVLSKEDPRETFLKALPRQAASLDIIYPCTLKERLVRRRLRRMALAQEHFHNRRILGWALATLPQLPLVITPFPNVTLYFTAYKMVSHYQALQGCRTLRSAFERYDQEEREALQRRHAVEQTRSNGCSGGLIGGLARLLPLPLRRGSAEGCGGSGKDKGQGGSLSSGGDSTSSTSSVTSPAGPPLPQFRCSKALDQATRPLERWHAPLPDEIAAQIEELFHPKPKTTANGHDGAAKKTTKKDGGGAGSRGADIGVDGTEQETDTGSGQLQELVTRLRTQVLQREQKQGPPQKPPQQKHAAAAAGAK